MTLPKDILPQVTAAELDAFSTIGGEERLIAFVNRFRELERERIIKLLEATSDLTSIECGQLVNYADTAIKLIKGE